MENSEILHIISKYFNNEATIHEIEILDGWCAESDENKKEFIRLKKIWILSNGEINKKIEQSKIKVWNNILNNVLPQQSTVYTKRSLITYLSVAVAATVLLTLSIPFVIDVIKGPSFQYTEVVTPKGEKGQLHLPDGTNVWLNSGSKVTMDNLFNTGNRIVRLEGEAYFDVAKNEKSKFIVETDGIDIIVHGTAFKVASYPESADVTVALQRGKVSILRHENNQLLCELLPNQEVVINKNSFASDIHCFDPDDYISWTFDELIFEYASVDEVFSKMENWFGVDIKVVSPPADLKYRFKIKTETLSEILALLNKMAPIHYSVNGKEVTITYK